jgi:predicted permease
MATFLTDLRYTLRGLARSPGFTLAAVASLALGIGANTLIFTFLNALFLSPLPVADPAHLVTLYEKDLHSPELLAFSYPNYLDLRRADPVLADVAAYQTLSLSLVGGAGEPALLPGALVSGNYFATLGLTPYRGRFFLPEEDQPTSAHPVAVMSYGLWQRRFGAAPGLVGSVLQINGRGLTVVGIAPPRFAGLSLLAEPPDLWVPAGLHRDLLTGPAGRLAERRDTLLFGVVARLKPGTSLALARSATTTVARQLERLDPVANQDLDIAVVPIAQTTVAPAQRGTYLLAGGLLAAVVGVLLLIAGANVANLLLIRALGRNREISVRLALGSARGRLARQLLTEGATLSLLGGAAGLLLALWGRKLLWGLRPPFFPDNLDLGLDWRVLAFTFGVALATGLAFGAVPVLHSFRLDLAANLSQQTGTPNRRTLAAMLRTLMLAAQVALSLVILGGAGLFFVSLRRAEQIDPGFEREKLFVVPLSLAAQGYAPARAQRLYERAVERVGALPGVRSAAVASRFLLVDAGDRIGVEAEGQPARPGQPGIQASVSRIGPGYFQTVGMALRAGRGVVAEDRPDGHKVAVINDTLAGLLWPGQSALGKRFRFSGEQAYEEVVGVAATARYHSLGTPPEPYVYLPVLQNYSSTMLLHVRTAGDPSGLVQAVRREVRELDPNLALLDAHTIGQLRERSLWAPRMGAGLLALFGLLALALASVGIYGVFAYMVGQRRREIGIRMANGAQRADLLRLVLADGMKPVLAGVAAGLVILPLAARPIRHLLFGVSVANPLAVGGAALLLLAVAGLALLLPARRASRLDPVQALRLG